MFDDKVGNTAGKGVGTAVGIEKGAETLVNADSTAGYPLSGITRSSSSKPA